MNGYLKQIITDDYDSLYLFPVDIETEIVKTAFINYQEGGFEESFEEWWNTMNKHIQIERVWTDNIYINEPFENNN